MVHRTDPTLPSAGGSRLPPAVHAASPTPTPPPTSSSLCSLEQLASTCLLDRLWNSISTFFSSLCSYIACLFCGETREAPSGITESLVQTGTTPAHPARGTAPIIPDRPISLQTSALPKDLTPSPILPKIGSNFLTQYIPEHTERLAFPEDYRVAFIVVVDHKVIGVLGRNVRGTAAADSSKASLEEVSQEAAPLLEACLKEQPVNAAGSPATMYAISINRPDPTIPSHLKQPSRCMRTLCMEYTPEHGGVTKQKDNISLQSTMRTSLNDYCIADEGHNRHYSILLKDFLVEWGDDKFLIKRGFWYTGD